MSTEHFPSHSPSSPPPMSSHSLQDNVGREELALLRSFPSVFAGGTPKHALQGVGDAVQNIAVGVGLGFSGLVALPTVLGKNEGLVGVLKGVALGTASCIGLSAYGTGKGILQMVKGVWNTWEALVETIHGFRYWDSVQGRWVDVQLPDLLAELPVTDDDLFSKARQLYRERTGGDSGAAGGGGERGLAAEAGTDDYYAILGLARTAPAAEIRTTFRRKAVEMHPDKNMNDEGATMRFQKLLEAYNVLSNEDSRFQYDTHGTVNSTLPNDKAFTDIEESLGAPFLEAFIGRVEMTVAFTPNVLLTSDIRKELRHRRILRLAQQLLRFLDDEGGVEAAQTLIYDAVRTRAGPKLMPIVADQYAAAARQHLRENGFVRELDSFFTSKWQYISRSGAMIALFASVAVKAARKSISEEDMLNFLLTSCEGDVQRTVLRACRLVLYDLSASQEERKRRAMNLYKLSTAVTKACSKS